MSPNDDDTADRIGPKLRLESLALPPHVGERLGQLHGTDRIERGAEWVTEIHASVRETEGRRPTIEDLCTREGGAHSVEIDGETNSFVCVLDPLMIPFLQNAPGTVRSETPEDGAVVVEVGASGATADPETAVVSLGVSHDVATSGAVTPETVYSEVCPYIHAFQTAAAYERWDRSVDAATTSVSIRTGVALARELARNLVVDPESRLCDGGGQQNC
jgi:hypothetical protein